MGAGADEQRRGARNRPAARRRGDAGVFGFGHLAQVYPTNWSKVFCLQK